MTDRCYWCGKDECARWCPSGTSPECPKHRVPRVEMPPAPDMRIADPVAAVERGIANIEATEVRSDGNALPAQEAAGRVTVDSVHQIADDVIYLDAFAGVNRKPSNAAAEEFKRIWSSPAEWARKYSEAMGATHFGANRDEAPTRLEGVNYSPDRKRPEPPTLADFNTSVEQHLLPLLPGRYRVVGDKRGDQPYGFDGWVLDEHNREVHRFEAFGALYEEKAEEIARDVAWALMQRQARGK